MKKTKNNQNNQSKRVCSAVFFFFFHLFMLLPRNVECVVCVQNAHTPSPPGARSPHKSSPFGQESFGGNFSVFIVCACAVDCRLPDIITAMWRVLVLYFHMYY